MRFITTPCKTPTRRHIHNPVSCYPRLYFCALLAWEQERRCWGGVYRGASSADAWCGPNFRLRHLKRRFYKFATIKAPAGRTTKTAAPFNIIRVITSLPRWALAQRKHPAAAMRTSNCKYWDCWTRFLVNKWQVVVGDDEFGVGAGADKVHPARNFQNKYRW